MTPALRQTGVTSFQPMPVGEPLELSWPTLNRSLFSDPARYVAATRANPEYGRPGWTRDCGQRFHRGLDIAPLSPKATGRTTQVMFTDCSREEEYPSEEAVWEVDEPVFAVAEGVVHEVNRESERSDLGRYVVLAHRWPGSRGAYFTLYAHLESVVISVGAALPAGADLGRMGQTSSSADARNWMAIAPHLHFELWNGYGQAHNPEEFLRRWLPH